MSVLDTLITNRTTADVNRLAYLVMRAFNNMTASEKAEWASDLKGAYNASDLNRVGNAVDYMAGILLQAISDLAAYRAARLVSDAPFFDVPYSSADVVVNPKMDWAETDTPTRAQEAQYYADLLTLAGLLPIQAFTFNGWDGLTYTEANDIERLFLVVNQALTELIDLLHFRIDNAQLSLIFSGEVNAGEV